MEMKEIKIQGKPQENKKGMEISKEVSKMGVLGEMKGIDAQKRFEAMKRMLEQMEEGQALK